MGIYSKIEKVSITCKKYNYSEEYDEKYNEEYEEILKEFAKGYPFETYCLATGTKFKGLFLGTDLKCKPNQTVSGFALYLQFSEYCPEVQDNLMFDERMGAINIDWQGRYFTTEAFKKALEEFRISDEFLDFIIRCSTQMARCERCKERYNISD